MFYPDLTEYSYDTRLPGVVDVGWLDDAPLFAVGAVDDALLRKLTALA